MTNQTNQGVYIPQKQMILLLASIMITISVAIIFSAIFVTNLVQSKVASAQSASQPNATQAATTRGQTPGVVYAEWSYEDPNAGCTVPTGGRGGGESVSQQINASSTPTTVQTNSPSSASYRTATASNHYSKPKAYTAPKYHKSKSYASNNISNSYNNSYSNNYNRTDIDNSVKNVNSFNQGSFNNVKGDLTQTNNNNSNVNTKIINQPSKPQKPHDPRKPHDNRDDREHGQNGSNNNNQHENGPRENGPRERDNRDNDHRNNDQRGERDNRPNRGQNQNVTATVSPEATGTEE